MISPNLAYHATRDDLSKLRYPVIVQPKYDGVRTIIHPTLGPVSRAFKPVPNNHSRRLLSLLPPNIEGEYIIPGATFNETSGAWRNATGEPNFVFVVFDSMLSHIPDEYKREGYAARYDILRRLFNQSNVLPFAQMAGPSSVVGSLADLLRVEESLVAQGFEGIVIRSPDAPYKCGRSTLREGGLIAFKRFETAEGCIVGYTPLFTNSNEKTEDAFGYSKRSSHQENRVGTETLGALLVHVGGGVGRVAVGSGYTQAMRVELWLRRESLIGQTITFKYQKVEVGTKPRFPIFVGFRGDK